ncbi:MarR family transcriptional regulator [Brevibacillus humidisoli]|uniref:MarR family winged helix-turn-helix transcriptional regulator n=1 Tax=Brevibacillus humidisoli TaxID=2895522 RepID=UPI001E550F27|nr:MarR family transcriptional regulator [Brevibacillus humidisoli]UFJ39000.1 MarR family transcriptional regulator [Brevibacillus humidisoli]
MDKYVLLKDRLLKLTKKVNSRLYQEFISTGFTVAQILVLKQLGEAPRTIGQISKAVDLSYSTVSGIIDRLEKQGFIERFRDDKDRRVVWIQQTEAAIEKRKNMRVFQEEYYHSLFANLSDDELDKILESLEILMRELDEKVGG